MKTVPNLKCTVVPNFYFKIIGGIESIHANFDIRSVMKKLPGFYMHCLESWATFSSSIPQNALSVGLQTIWNNRHILVGGRQSLTSACMTLE